MAHIQPGDLILVKTPGIGFAIARRLVRSDYDHVAVVMHNDNTLNIVMPRAVMLPLSVVSKPQNAPLVLRLNWHTIEQREQFIAEMQRYAGVAYDTRKTLIGIILVFLRAWLRVKFRLEMRDASTRKAICTEAILLSMMKALPDLEVIDGMELDYYLLGFGTTNDFMRIAKQFPNLLAVVPRTSAGYS